MRLFLLVAALEFKTMLRRSRYDAQILVFPSLAFSIFLTAYLAVKALGGHTGGIFYPFVTFLISAWALGVSMQSSTNLLSDPGAGHLLVTPRGLMGLLIFFSGGQVAYQLPNVATVVLAYTVTHPPIYLPNFVLGLVLLSWWSADLAMIGLATGMRFLFAHYLSQVFFLGFYLFLLLVPLVGNPLYSLIFPPIGIISIFQQVGSFFPVFSCTVLGIVIYTWLGDLYLRWAFREYQIGRGVNRV
ncbi:MAG: hypothetical protein ACUVUU_09875 [bacterium]